MKPLVSIIVPIYNGELYIQKCLDSILVQTYKNIEVVIINDGSTDGSINYLEKYSDERIRYFNIENQGVSVARNYGIDKSNGEYLLFIDVDDYVNEDIVEKLVNLVENDTTFVFCDNFEVWTDRTDTRTLFNNLNKELRREDVIKEIASGKAGLVCSKLISKKVVADNKIYFDGNLKVGEDQLFFLQVANYCKTFKYVKEPLYFYDRTNESSSTIKYQFNLIENFMYLYMKTEEFFINNYLESDSFKRILGDKLLDFIWICANNEVGYLGKQGLSQCTNHITKIIMECEEKLKYPYEPNKLNRKLAELLMSKSKKLAALKLIVIIKLFNLKMKVRNRLNYGTKG